MNLFFDTSALVKYFHSETGTTQVINLIDDSNNVIWVSDLVIGCADVSRRICKFSL